MFLFAMATYIYPRFYGAMELCTWGQFYLFFVVGTTFDERQNGTIVLSIDLWSTTMAKRYWVQLLLLLSMAEIT